MRSQDVHLVDPPIVAPPAISTRTALPVADTATRDQKNDALFFVAQIVALASLGVSVPVIPRFVLWFGCWVLVVKIFDLFVGKRLGVSARTASWALACLVGAVVSISYGRPAYRVELAMANEGDLRPPRPWYRPEPAITGPPILQIGNFGVRRAWMVGQSAAAIAAYGGPVVVGRKDANTPPNSLVQLQDVDHNAVTTYQHFTLYQGADGPEVTATVRNPQGAIIVYVNKNHWTVEPGHSVDHNATDDSLEVLDERGRVALYLQLFDDNRVEVAGVFWLSNGKGGKIFSSAPYRGYPEVRNIEAADDAALCPAFRYPRSQHWGERVTGAPGCSV